MNHFRFSFSAFSSVFSVLCGSITVFRLDTAPANNEPGRKIRPGIAGGLRPGLGRDRMADVFSRRKRAQVMSRIRGSGNRDTELRLIAIFRAHGFTGWRRGRPLPGKPDFVFPHEKLAVFVDGCFWHGCPIHATWPKNNAAFWRKKILGNRRRDLAVNSLLRRAGWRVVRIWEHELRRSNEARLLARLFRHLGTPGPKADPG